MSDRTWSPRWGRRKPYFLIGAMGCSICLFLYPFCTALWMAVLLLWLLDASNNTAMEPYRAFIADKLPPSQHAQGLPHPELLHRPRHHPGQRLAVRLPEAHRPAGPRRASRTGCSAPSSLGAVCSIGIVLHLRPDHPGDPADRGGARAPAGQEEGLRLGAGRDRRRDQGHARAAVAARPWSTCSSGTRCSATGSSSP